MIGPVGSTGQPVDRGNRRLGPGGEHQSARRAELAPAGDDGAAAGHGGATTDEPAALAGEPLNRDRVVPVVSGLLPDPPGPQSTSPAERWRIPPACRPVWPRRGCSPPG